MKIIEKNTLFLFLIISSIKFFTCFKFNLKGKKILPEKKPDFISIDLSKVELQSKKDFYDFITKSQKLLLDLNLESIPDEIPSQEISNKPSWTTREIPVHNYKNTQVKKKKK